jgi:hypothetical protein
MSVVLDVEPAVLTAAAGWLDAAGAEMMEAASRIRSAAAAAGLGDPSMAAGVEAVAGAWGGDIELVGSTTAVLATLVAWAADGYVATDRAVAPGVAPR